MTLNEMIARFRVQVPTAKASVISDVNVTTMLNEGVDKVNLLSKIYKGSVLFTMTTNKQSYDLSIVASRFVLPDKVLARFLTSGSVYRRMWPKTRTWIEKKVENWLAADSGDPQYYWFDGDEFWVHPKPNATRTSGFKLYGLLSAVPMSAGDNYPWTNTASEIKAFRPMDQAIVAYARMQVTPSLGEKDTGGIDYKGFLEEVNRGMRQVKRRPDVSSDESYGMIVS